MLIPSDTVKEMCGLRYRDIRSRYIRTYIGVTLIETFGKVLRDSTILHNKKHSYFPDFSYWTSTWLISSSLFLPCLLQPLYAIQQTMINLVEGVSYIYDNQGTPFWKPYWCMCRPPFFSTSSCKFPYRSTSSSLLIVLNMHNGRYDVGSSNSFPFFSINATFTSWLALKNSLL